MIKTALTLVFVAVLVVAAIGVFSAGYSHGYVDAGNECMHIINDDCNAIYQMCMRHDEIYIPDLSRGFLDGV